MLIFLALIMCRFQCPEKSIIRDGLPELAQVSSAADGNPSTSDNHEAADILFDLRWPFGVWPDLYNKLNQTVQSPLWSRLGSPVHGQSMVLPLGFNGEVLIQTYVKDALEEIVGALSDVLPVHVQLQQELQYNSQKADIWVLLLMGVPIGAIEVKKSGRRMNVTNDPLVAGQLYDYLTTLRNFYGLDHVFGIATTYREWRIFWLEDTEDAARETDMSKFPLPTAATRVDLRPATPVEGKEAVVTDLSRVTLSDAGARQPSCMSTDQGPRRVRAGRIMLWNDSELVLALATVIVKMATSTTTKRTVLFENGRPYTRVTPSSAKWETPSALKRPTFNARMPRADCTDFYLLAHLGDGVHGRAYLAMTPFGTGVVLKFPRGIPPPKNIVDGPLNAEAKLWKEVWGVNARVQLLANTAVLVMPYFRTCQWEDDRTPEAKTAARAAIKQMVSRGWEQNDLKWEHVGVYRDSGGVLRAVLVDLGDVSAVAPADRVTAEQRMLDKLGL